MSSSMTLSLGMTNSTIVPRLPRAHIERRPILFSRPNNTPVSRAVNEIITEERKLIEYIDAALKNAVYESLGDGTYFAEVPGLAGVWANASTHEACKIELAEVIEDWVRLGQECGDPIPVLDGIDLNDH